MPQPNKIPKAFAASGDRNIIPESTGTLGLASWNEGFPAITSVPFAEGGLAPKRADFNGIFNALSVATVWQQQGGIWEYDATTNYEIGNIVVDAGQLYICKTANGPDSALHSPSSDTAETYWGRVFRQNGTFDRMFFSQTSGNYTAPYTGIYRITLKGGGGGGGGSYSNTRSGGGGGEGGAVVMYRTLTKSTSYAYTIGAGGAGGTYADNGSGGDGGTSQITIGNTTYQVPGGKGGKSGYSGSYGGAGGTSAVANAYNLRGCPGGSGLWRQGTSDVTLVSGAGGGNGGGAGTGYTGVGGSYGSGGSGGGVAVGDSNGHNGAAGGTGYILIEYSE